MANVCTIQRLTIKEKEEQSQPKKVLHNLKLTQAFYVLQDQEEMYWSKIFCIENQTILFTNRASLWLTLYQWIRQFNMKSHPLGNEVKKIKKNSPWRISQQCSSAWLEREMGQFTYTIQFYCKRVMFLVIIVIQLCLTSKHAGLKLSDGLSLQTWLRQLLKSSSKKMDRPKLSLNKSAPRSSLSFSMMGVYIFTRKTYLWAPRKILERAWCR